MIEFQISPSYVCAVHRHWIDIIQFARESLVSCAKGIRELVVFFSQAVSQSRSEKSDGSRIGIVSVLLHHGQQINRIDFGMINRQSAGPFLDRIGSSLSPVFFVFLQLVAGFSS